ncbi:MAG: T9SS C-terminal target domain-containing protein [Ignavibacteriales bacterium]|nr:MAG: T9SS C-terminal target domain-containing protein [Ignavibacteriales bacterium]
MEMIITYQLEKDFFPYFLVTLNVYGWKNASFLILKISVQNLLNRDVVANLGVEVIPQIDSEFGYERVKITETSKMIMIYKQTFLGLKYCNSKELLFANVFEWDYDYFKNDSVIYKGMTNKIIDTSYTASEKGSVITGCIRPISIPKGDSIATSLFILAGKYQYELENALRMAEKNYKILTSVKDEHVLPEEIYLKQNYPNPFNPVTKIKFSIPVETLRSTKGGTSFQNVILKVYDVLGREAATLVNEEKPPGNYEVEFNGENLPTGIYFYKLTSGEKSITRKMLLVR